jgi:DNA-binding NarL/FixJ family response regulator
VKEIMTPIIVALVIVKPGYFRESIQILLTSISQINEVCLTESLTEALSLAEIIKPAIVILDSQATNHDLVFALNLISDTWNGASRIVLTEDKNEFQKGTTNSADLVLLKGFNASKFITGIEDVLRTNFPT